MNLRQTFSALKHSNYRLWFFGQLVSLLGTWMQSTAQGFLVFELTRSPAYLGYVAFSFGLPSWVLMLYGGVVADRLPRRALLTAAQSAMMALAFLLAGLTFFDLVQPWHIIVLAFLLGVANAFDAPARHAFVYELVEREDITNAVALNSTLFNLSAVAGPAAAGFIYSFMGPEWCFTLNGISYLAIIWALCMMRLRARPAQRRSTSALESIREGIGYAATSRVISSILILVGATALFGFAFATLLPAWSVTILGGDATTNGLLHSARGAGAVMSALLIASLGRFQYRGRLLSAGAFLFPALLAVFACVRTIPLSLAVMVAVGAALVLVMNISNALLQTSVEDHMRGRIMSIFSLTHFGLMPLGGLLAGLVAERAGETAAVTASAAICFICAALLRLRIPELSRLK